MCWLPFCEQGTFLVALPALIFSVTFPYVVRLPLNFFLLLFFSEGQNIPLMLLLFEAGSHVAGAGLKLAMYSRVTFNSDLYLPNAGIPGLPSTPGLCCAADKPIPLFNTF